MKINYRLLKHRCNQSFAQYEHEPGAQVFENSSGERHIFFDRGANILAIAHLDSVAGSRHFHRIVIDGLEYIFTRQADDRLGAYLILDFLPRLGVQCDVLLTDGEETGSSTGRDFTPPEGKTYNWMFQFDRAGTDVVMYQYKSDERKQMLVDCGFKVGIGSFSDISRMGHLGIAGFNFGCGYQENHTKLSHIITDDTMMMVEKFLVFYANQSEVAMPYDNTKPAYPTYDYWDKDWGDSYKGRYLSGYYNGSTSGYWCDECYCEISDDIWYKNGGLCNKHAQKPYRQKSPLCDLCGLETPEEEWLENSGMHKACLEKDFKNWEGL